MTREQFIHVVRNSDLMLYWSWLADGVVQKRMCDDARGKTSRWHFIWINHSGRGGKSSFNSKSHTYNGCCFFNCKSLLFLKHFLFYFEKDWKFMNTKGKTRKSVQFLTLSCNWDIRRRTFRMDFDWIWLVGDGWLWEIKSNKMHSPLNSSSASGKLHLVIHIRSRKGFVLNYAADEYHFIKLRLKIKEILLT